MAALGLGAAGVGGALLVLKRGFDDLAEGQKVMAQTTAGIKSTGGAANVSAKQVSDLANSLSEMSGADDEAIQAGENMLLTFTNIRNEAGKNNDIFNQTSAAVLDMATKMNSGAIPSTEQLAKNSILVGKAMNDPIKGLTALSRVGVTFTEGQKKTIKALAESGHVMEAQKLILKELNKEFGGSAKAAGQTLPGQLSKLKNSFDNVASGIVAGLAPALTRGLGALNKFITRIGAAQGLKAKVVVAAQFVWSGLKQGVAVLQKEFSDLLFGSFSKGGGVGPEGIKFNEGLISKFTEAFAALDWSAVGQAVIDGIVTAIQKTGELAKSLATTVTAAIREVPWDEVGKVLGPGFAAMITAAFVTLTDPSFWIKNWDLALAVGLTIFGGSLAKFGLKLAAPFAQIGLKLSLAVIEPLERLSPRLAAVFEAAIRAIPALFTGLSKTVDAILTAMFGRLAHVARFVLEVVGIDIAIQAIAGFVKTVAGFFTNLGHTIGSALDTAWRTIEVGALKAASGILEPFTHLPFGLGAWAQKAQQAVQQKLNAIDAAQTVKKMQREFDGQIATFRKTGGDYAAAIGAGLDVLIVNGRIVGQKAGRATGAGVAEGLLEYVTVVANAAARLVGEAFAAAGRQKHGSGDWMFTKKEVGVPLALGIIEGFTSVMATRGREFAKAVAGPWYSIINTLGPALSERLVKSIGAGIDKAAPAAVKGLNHVGQLIVAAAKKYGVDARAALAVAMGEGGIKFGAVGDSGHAFGPFQFNNAGGVATGKSAAEASAWANSAKGVADAVRMMAEAGAKGKVGLDAITAIIKNFERPLDPSASIAKAAAAYKTLGPQISSNIASGTEGVKKTISGQLTALAALVKQYAPQIGVEHARGIISGLVGKTPDIVAAAKRQMETVVAAMAKAAQARTDLKDAFRQMAQDALGEFDKATDAWVSPTRKKLNQMTKDDAINATVKAVADAQTAIDNAQAKLDTDLATPGIDPAQIEQDKADLAKAVEDLGVATRSYQEAQMELTAQSEETKHAELRERQRVQLELDFVQLQTWLAKHPGEYGKATQKIINLMKTYHIPMKKAGKALADMFGAGLSDGIATVVAQARRLANALEAIPGVPKPKDTGGVNPNSYGERGGGLGGGLPGGTSSGRSTAAMNITVNMPNYLGDKREAAQQIRQELQRIGRDNAINPLAV